MTESEKVAYRMLDYIYGCAKRGVAPLAHDANVFRAELERARGKEQR